MFFGLMMLLRGIGIVGRPGGEDTFKSCVNVFEQFSSCCMGALLSTAAVVFCFLVGLMLDVAGESSACVPRNIC